MINRELIIEKRKKHRKLIEEYAYKIWEKNGRPEGRSLEFWVRAEKVMGIIGETRWVTTSGGNHTLSDIWQREDLESKLKADAELLLG